MHPNISDPASSAASQVEHPALLAHPGVRKLQRSFTRLEEQKRDLLADLSTWTEEERRFRPAPNSWSALDVIEHLVKVECESLAHIQTKLSDSHPVTIRERIGARVVFAVMLSPLRIKTPPSVAAVLPDGSATENEIVGRWHDVRKDMNLLTERLRPDQLTSGLFHHPVSGSMGMVDALTFLSVHITHHTYQLRRIRTAFAKR